MPSLTYDQTLEWLYALEARKGMDFRLERLQPVLDRLGRPESAFPAIHVAGTNGKGSTCAMLHSIYTQGGYRAGFYSSPHLLSFTERIRVGMDQIREQDVVEQTNEVRAAAADASVDLTFFEMTTLVSFLEFRRREVDLAVVEVGLGGRLDATNVVSPVASVITTIGHDHGEHLGDTLAEIAREKAGIVKPGAVVVTGALPGEALASVAEKVTECEARWLRYGRDFDERELRLPATGAVTVSLTGAHQAHNAAVALATVQALQARFPLAETAIASGFERTRWPGRLEVLGRAPWIIVDAAHNPHAITALRSALDNLAMPHPRVLVFGVMIDKDWRSMLRDVVPLFDRVVFVPVANRRSLDPRRAQDVASDLRPCEVSKSAALGIRRARELVGRDGAIVVTGSVFLLAEVYRDCGGGEERFGV